MYQPPPGFEVVQETRQRSTCMESRFVLDAIGISSHVGNQGGRWLLSVGSEDLQEAIRELEDYRQENVDRSSKPRISIPTYSGAVVASLVYIAVLVLVDFYSSREAFGVNWDLVGRMQADKVTSGDWWRVFTALTLHVDLGHLLSNLAYGCVFGLLAGRVLGGGVAWLTIVVAGAMGNFANALIQPPEHASIGASTAVFAALGVLVAHALRPRANESEKLFRRWSPLIGGVVLLAMTGVGGERTDVAAHFTGFIAGLIMGWLGCRLPHRWLANPSLQVFAGLITIGLIGMTWKMVEQKYGLRLLGK